MEILKELIKVELIKGEKVPAVKKWNNIDYCKTVIDEKKYDTGILTGKKNNLLVVDIDVKDNGVEEWKKYIKQYGDINTLTMKTMNNGLHLYFKYEHSKIEVQYLIDNMLKNKAKYRNGQGIDIRSNGGYIKAYPSKGYKVINNVQICEIPEELVLWILEEETNEEVKPKKNSKKIITKKIIVNNNNKTSDVYDITDGAIINILNMLDSDYHEKYYKWFIIITILKTLINSIPNAYEIFDTFSKRSPEKYDKNNNNKIWNNTCGRIDINYLINKINREKNLKLKLVAKCTVNNEKLKFDQFEKCIVNEKFVNINYDTFRDNNTIVIQSVTGTGKTTNVASLVSQYLKDNENIKFMSINNLINITMQQLETFDQHGLKLLNYQSKSSKELHQMNFICCINSIHNKLEYFSDEDYKNYIVYIDEVTALNNSLLFNDTLDKNLKKTYLVLMKIIKNAHKVIFSDAFLNTNVINLLKNRNDDKKYLYQNEFLKYAGIIAIRYNDENMYLSLLIEYVKIDKYFMLLCDSKTIATKFYNKLITMFSDKKDKFELITSDTSFVVKEASKQFLKKFIITSPTILNSVSVVFEHKQDVFIYIKGNTISPELSFQQTTRTRNIGTVHYYSSCLTKNRVYNSLDDVYEKLKTKETTNEKILNLCLTIDENDDEKIVQNTFFNMYCNGLYEQDFEQTNKLLHYEKILKEQGFILQQVGTDKVPLKKELKKELTVQFKQLKDDIFNELLMDFENVNDDNYNFQLDKINSDQKYKTILKRANVLGIDDLKFNEFKKILTDEQSCSQVFSLLKLFMNTEHLQEQLKISDNMNVKKAGSINSKILLIRKFENTTGINPFDVNLTTSTIKFNKLDDAFVSHIKNVFRIKKEKPTNNYELKIFYVTILKNLIGSLEVIGSKRQKTKDRKDVINYFIDTEKLKDLVENGLKLKLINYFDKELLEMFDIDEPIDKVDVCLF
jgi:hypothetical protein